MALVFTTDTNRMPTHKLLQLFEQPVRSYLARQRQPNSPSQTTVPGRRIHIIQNIPPAAPQVAQQQP
ncbi:hypothetical protein LB505_002005 [Fusarium chuoi]|nr:hypothetical protein LB505_002005 [Fusarium chuoi]